MAEAAQRWLEGLESREKERVVAVLGEMTSAFTDWIRWVHERHNTVDAAFSVLGFVDDDEFEDEQVAMEVFQYLSAPRFFDIDPLQANWLSCLASRAILYSKTSELRFEALRVVRQMCTNRNTLDPAYGVFDTIRCAWEMDLDTKCREMIVDIIGDVFDYRVLDDRLHLPAVQLCVDIFLASSDPDILRRMLRVLANLPPGLCGCVYDDARVLKKLVDFDSVQPHRSFTRYAISDTMRKILLSEKPHIDAFSFFSSNPDSLRKIVASVGPGVPIFETFAVVTQALIQHPHGCRLMMDCGLRQKLHFTIRAPPFDLPLLADVPAWNVKTGLDLWQTLITQAAPEDIGAFNSDGSFLLMLHVADKNVFEMDSSDAPKNGAFHFVDPVEVLLFGSAQQTGDPYRRLIKVFSHPRTVKLVLDNFFNRDWTLVGGVRTVRLRHYFHMVCRLIDSTGTTSMITRKDNLDHTLARLIEHTCRSEDKDIRVALWDIRVLLSHGALPYMGGSRLPGANYGLGRGYYSASNKKGARFKEVERLFFQHGLAVDWSEIGTVVARTKPWVEHEARQSPVCRERAAIEAAVSRVLPPELVRLCGIYTTVHPEDRSFAYG